jgi:hypothetical protein
MWLLWSDSKETGVALDIADTTCGNLSALQKTSPFIMAEPHTNWQKTKTYSQHEKGTLAYCHMKIYLQTFRTTDLTNEVRALQHLPKMRVLIQKWPQVWLHLHYLQKKLKKKLWSHCCVKTLSLIASLTIVQLHWHSWPAYAYRSILRRRSAVDKSNLIVHDLSLASGNKVT